MRRDLAWKIGAKVVSGRGQVAATIASQFLHELGPRAPRAKKVQIGRKPDTPRLADEFLVHPYRYTKMWVRRLSEWCAMSHTRSSDVDLTQRWAHHHKVAQDHANPGCENCLRISGIRSKMGDRDSCSVV